MNTDCSCNILLFIGLPLIGYFVGSVPFGLLIGFFRGVDVRTQGSGNIGSTNVGRVLGRKWGYLCFVLDVLKGVLPVVIAGRLLRGGGPHTGAIPAITSQWIWLATGAGCILGHMFSVFLKFKGGKGVATSLGVVLGISPVFTLTGVFAFAVWLGVWGWSRYVSLASIIAAISFPVGFGMLIYRLESWTLKALWPMFAFSCLMAILVIVKHRSNISRLLAGTENRGGKKG